MRTSAAATHAARIVSVALVATAVGAAADIGLRAPAAVSPGEVLRVVIDSDGASVGTVVFELVDAAGEAHIQGVHAFRTAPRQWVALFGIPSTLQPGDYLIVASATPAGDALSSPIRVSERAFASLDIPLDASLTELRRSHDPRKEAQARELLAVLTSFDTKAGYHAGTLEMPLAEPHTTSGYGDRRRYVYADGSTALSVHRGVDLAAAQGAPVRAAGTGKVAMATSRIVSGNTVVIEHLPGVFSVYYHLHDMNVVVGDRIAAGKTIGTVGSTGLATGAHLHWEVRVGVVAVDPVRLIAAPLLGMSR